MRHSSVDTVFGAVGFYFFLSICIHVPLIQSVDISCYTPPPTNEVRTSSQPCSQTGSASTCCATGWVCTNITGLCVAGPSVTLNPGDPTQFEGTCTDKTWNSAQCPTMCRNGNLSENAANGVWNCGGGNWCCSAFAGDESCCTRNTNNQEVFFLGNYENTTTIGGSVASGYGSTTTSSSSTATTSATTTTGSSSLTSTATSSSATSTTTTSPDLRNSTPTSSLSTGAKAGIGIAAAAGVIILAVLGFFIYRQYKSTRELKDQVRLLGGVPGSPNGSPGPGREVKQNAVELASVSAGPPGSDISSPNQTIYKDSPQERYELGYENNRYSELQAESRRMG